MSSRRLSPLPLVLALSGCAAVNIGQDFDLQKFEAEVQRGSTTQKDIRQWLGEPVSTGVVVNTEGRRFTRWVYYYGQGKPMRFKDVSFKMLEVQFDKNKIVQGYDWSGD